MSRVNKASRLGLLVMVSLGLSGPEYCGAESPDYSVPVNKGSVITLPVPADRVEQGNPQQTEAEVHWLDRNHIFINGRQLGTTNLVLCDHRSGCFRSLRIEVTHDLESLKYKLHEVFPDESPKVYSSQGAIVLAGQVSSVEKMNAMLAIAGTFAQPGSPGQAGGMGMGGGVGGGMGGVAVPTYDTNRRVINLMQVGGPQQVMLGVTVAEMSTSLARRLKVNFSAFGGGSDIQGGAIASPDLIKALIDSLASSAATAYNPSALFLRFAGSDAQVRTFITASRENGLAKILAEPNLTTISGQDAEFQSGGSFPVPVFNFGGGGTAGGAAGGANVLFKDYGVILKFLPVVLDTHRISLKVNINVSELSNENAITVPVGDGVNYSIPSLIQRGASSALELDSGQTMGIAGLINDRTRETITKFPGLGDIPVLGQLFTSQEFVRSETELMIFVTPQLAKPVDPGKLRLPTDDFVEPSDTEYYWMGRTEGLLDQPRRPAGQQRNYGGMRGHFGPKVENYRP